MSDYKLMPEEATPEMEQAAEKYWNDRKFKALSDDPRTWKGLYAAMRAAAPADYVCHKCGKKTSPPKPFKLYVSCESCGATTAATIAKDLATLSPDEPAQDELAKLRAQVKELEERTNGH